MIIYLTLDVEFTISLGRKGQSLGTGHEEGLSVGGPRPGARRAYAYALERVRARGRGRGRERERGHGGPEAPPVR